MIVVLVLAGLAVLGAVVAVAMGLGGELSPAPRDHPPLSPPPPGTAPYAAVAAPGLRLPRGLWGYQTDAADQAIDGLMRALHDREGRMAALERQLADLKDRLGENGHGEPGGDGGATEESGPPSTPWDTPSTDLAEATRVDLKKGGAGAADPEEARK